tara:strand:- start:3740 stop:4033 length:294 start_codon:yes stop_codon:yes gene_type:complete
MATVQPSVISTGQQIGPEGPSSYWDGFVSTVFSGVNTAINRTIDERLPESNATSVPTNIDPAVTNNAPIMGLTRNQVMLTGAALLGLLLVVSVSRRR